MATPRRRPLRAVSDQPQRVVLYRRVSALMGRAGDDFHSPEIQLDAMRRSTAGMREVGIIDDIDTTGTTLDREGLNKIRAMVTRKEVDVVAFMNVTRLGRNVLESLQFVAWLEQRGVVILSAHEQMDTSTPAGRMMLINMLNVAEHQSRQIGESWSRTIEIRARQGKHHGKPFGYRRVKGQPLQPDPVTGPIVTWAFEAYARGVPMGEIARETAARRGKTMFTANIKTWFHNPVYLGHVHAGGEVVAFAAHPPLTDQPTWDAVQRRLARDTKAPARHLDPTWSLVGLIYCPHGHRLQRMPTVYRGGRVDRLTCGMGVSRGVAQACDGIGNPRLEPVEAEVLRQVRDYMGLLRTDDAARAARMARRAHSGLERAELERALFKTQGGITRLSKGWALGDVPDTGYYGPMGELRAAEVELRRQLDGLVEPVVLASPDEAADAAGVLLELWPDATFAERGRMLRAVVLRVVVRRAAFWREPEADRVSVEFA